MRQNQLANAVTYRNWVDSHTPQEIIDANNARTYLKRLKKNARCPRIIDARLPARALTAHRAFTKAGFSAAHVAGTRSAETITALSAQWKALSAEERKVCMPPRTSHHCGCC